jgi:hypothetical protein
MCKDICLPLTPNGCDCFGCCENPNKPGTYVFAGSLTAENKALCGGTAAELNDPTKCEACTPVLGCKKTCGHCQLCFGKTTLPQDCYDKADGGTPINDMGYVPPQQCLNGEQPCGLPGQAACPDGYYCITGCCQSTIF